MLVFYFLNYFRNTAGYEKKSTLRSLIFIKEKHSMPWQVNAACLGGPLELGTQAPWAQCRHW